MIPQENKPSDTTPEATPKKMVAEKVPEEKPPVPQAKKDEGPETKALTRATWVQAISTVVLVAITFYYAWETRQIRKESSVSAQANKIMAEANKELSRTNIEMARTAELNLKISQDMLTSAKDSIAEARIARQEQMRPYLSYQSHSFYREGIGYHYMIWLVNEGLTPAKDIKIKPDNPKAPVSTSVSFLGPKQNSRISWARSDQMKDQGTPKSFNLSITYKDINGKDFQQEIPIELGDEDPNSLAAIREQFFKLNMTMDDIHLLMQNDARKKSREQNILK
ncbi:MAG TPA: hypothetical protein DD723_10075 [Candidatus Omnitrophica bacterium]|nr:hypothetical protein [Candidatus Omnitrophota bacterium]